MIRKIRPWGALIFKKWFIINIIIVIISQFIIRKMWPSTRTMDLMHPLLDPNAGDIDMSPTKKSSPSNSEISGMVHAKLGNIRGKKKNERTNEIRVITREELAWLMRQRDLSALEELGGVEGIAALIQQTLLSELTDGSPDESEHRRSDFDDRAKRSMSAGSLLSTGMTLPPRAAELRRERFGTNRVRQRAGPHAGLPHLLLEALQEDTSVLILALAAISVALGVVECQPAYFDPDPGLGHVGGDSCPPRPLWAGSGPIDLPMVRDYPAAPGGGGGGGDDGRR